MGKAIGGILGMSVGIMFLMVLLGIVGVIFTLVWNFALPTMPFGVVEATFLAVLVRLVIGKQAVV